MKFKYIVLAALLGVTACKKELPPNVDSSTQTAAQTAAQATEPMTEEDAVTVVEQWLQTQNEGNFEAYTALYAKAFQGIKHVGPETLSYGHESWLSDRGRMFRTDPMVSIDEPSYVYSGVTAVVRFEQRRKSKEFEDLGQTVLVLVKDPSGVHIVREEVLDPHVITHKERIWDPNRVSPVVLEQFIVLDDTIDPAWKTDTHRLLGDVPMHGPFAVAETWVNIAALPVEYKRLRERTFTLHGAQDCKATVQGFRIISRVAPHVSMVEDWQRRPAQKSAGHTIAQEIAKMVGGKQVLVAKLNKSCKDAVWAQAIEDASTRVLTPEEIAFDELLPALENSETFVMISKRADEYGVDDWLKMDERVVPVYTIGKRRIASVALKSGNGCGEFYAEYSALVEIGDPPVLLTDSGASGFFDIEKVIQTSAGTLLIGKDRAAVLSVQGVDLILDWSSPYLNSSC